MPQLKDKRISPISIFYWQKIKEDKEGRPDAKHQGVEYFYKRGFLRDIKFINK